MDVLSFADTAIGVGIGAVSVYGIYFRKGGAKLSKLQETLGEYQEKYAEFEKEFNAINDRILAVTHDFTSQWPDLDFELTVTVLNRAKDAKNTLSAILKLLNELSRSKMSSGQLRATRKKLTSLSSDMKTCLELSNSIAKSSEYAVGKALKRVNIGRADLARLESIFDHLSGQFSEMKEKYDPMFLSEIGPAHFTAKTRIVAYREMLEYPQWRYAVGDPNVSDWDGAGNRAETAVRKFSNLVNESLNFNDTVFATTQQMRNTINRFVKSDPVLYNEIMRYIVEAENHTYVSRNPIDEFNSIVEPAVKFFNRKN
ncbi:MAG: hypothetical protein H9W81_10165 [Enterococcus sp.]|nr:hypothetical protein [Enterococcus sp.]